MVYVPVYVMYLGKIILDKRRKQLVSWFLLQYKRSCVPVSETEVK